MKVLDVSNHKSFNIPTISSSAETHPATTSCGIHAVEVNPSRTVLATTGENANDIAFYKLPTLEPLAVGENTHKDYVFDLKWLDDEYLISGSRDSTIALWRVSQDMMTEFSEKAGSSNEQFAAISTIKAIKCQEVHEADKVRQVCYNPDRKEIVALSLNSTLHSICPRTLSSKTWQELDYQQENVCLALSREHKMYAVGSKNYITLVDARNFNVLNNINSLFPHCGIRSLSFRNDLLTIGTGNGRVLFYDVRMRGYIKHRAVDVPAQEARPAFLSTSEGHLVS